MLGSRVVCSAGGRFFVFYCGIGYSVEFLARSHRAQLGGNLGGE